MRRHLSLWLCPTISLSLQAEVKAVAEAVVGDGVADGVTGSAVA